MHQESEDEGSYLSSGTSSYESDTDKKMKPIKVAPEEDVKEGESLVDK